MAVVGFSLFMASFWDALRKDVSDTLALIGIGLVFLAMLLAG